MQSRKKIITNWDLETDTVLRAFAKGLTEVPAYMEKLVGGSAYCRYLRSLPGDGVEFALRKRVSRSSL